MKFTETPETGSGGMFLRLKDGESVKGILRGENKVFYMRWHEGKSQPCKKTDEGAKFRFKFNIVTNDDGNYKAKVFENGPSLYNALKELAEDYNLEETIIKIKRDGVGLDTKYHVTPMPQKLTKEQIKEIANVELNSLESTDKKDIPNMAPNFDSDEEIPF